LANPESSGFLKAHLAVDSREFVELPVVLSALRGPVF